MTIRGYEHVSEIGDKTGFLNDQTPYSYTCRSAGPAIHKPCPRAKFASRVLLVGPRDPLSNENFDTVHVHFVKRTDL